MPVDSSSLVGITESWDSRSEKRRLLVYEKERIKGILDAKRMEMLFYLTSWALIYTRPTFNIRFVSHWIAFGICTMGGKKIQMTHGEWMKKKAFQAFRRHVVKLKLSNLDQVWQVSSTCSYLMQRELEVRKMCPSLLVGLHNKKSGNTDFYIANDLKVWMKKSESCRLSRITFVDHLPSTFQKLKAVF